jgi:uncharacterized glyoxalase superfamily protein PhnB
MPNRVCFPTVVLAVMAAFGIAGAQQTGKLPTTQSDLPTLVNTCLITNQMKSMVVFYELSLGVKAKWSGEDYAELPTGMGVVSIFSANAQEKYMPGSTVAARNQSVVLEFRVADVDQQYRRLQGVVTTWVKPPTNQPWGTRSIYFRDPDGNLVDFYMTRPHER